MGRPRPVSRRGRPPKNAESAQRLAQLRKPKYLYSGQKQQQSKLNSSSSVKSSRSRSKKKEPWEGESDEDEYGAASFSRISAKSAYFEDDEDEDRSLMSFGDDAKSGQWDEEEELEEDNGALDNDTSGSPAQAVSSNIDVSKFKMGRFLRAKSPPRFDDEDLSSMPPLKLPDSSADLLLPPHLASKYLMKILSIYEILNQFKFQLRLSAFRLEDFIASLLLNENNSLLSEIHVCLIKTLIREDEANSTLFGSQDVKDSIGIYLYNCDPLTWPTVLRMYIISRRREETPEVKEMIQLLVQNKDYEEYPINTPMEIKVKILQFLCDFFLETNIAREEIMNGDGGVRHDDHCRKCHKLGDLLCCDRCSSVWHLDCLEPPMQEVPEDEWVCSICKQMARETGCANEDGTIAAFGDDEGLFLRRYILGWDRHGNKYWWLCRRLIIEFNNEDMEPDENGQKPEKTIYISTKQRFLELMKVLDKDHYEKELYSVLNEIKDEVFKAMERTEKMTKDALKSIGVTRSMKTWIEFESEIAESEAAEESKAVEKKEEKPVNNSTEGIMTRLKTGSLKEKSVLSIENGRSDDDKDTIMVFDETLDPHFLQKMSKREAVSRGLFFKLGMETKSYVNLFSVNMLALNKHQIKEESDKERPLKSKFCITHNEFKWQGPVFGPLKLTIQNTLRQTLVHFENQLAAPFMHPNWSLHRQNWLKAVSMCTQPKDFALALSILESSVKPVLFAPVWNTSLGHTLLDRNTLIEREDRKKDEKRERREFMEEQEMIIRTTGGVKYSIMPHRGLQLERVGNNWFGFTTQSGSIGFGTTGGVGEGGGRGVQALWKQKGEEYRVSGNGGWMFHSFARSRHYPINDGEREEEIEIPEEFSGEVIESTFINISEDLRKERTQRSFYRKHRPFKLKRKGIKVMDGFLERRLLLEEAILQQKLKQEEEEKIKKEDDEAGDYIDRCYSPLCRISPSTNLDYLCYCISCRIKQKERKIRLEAEKKERQEIEERFKLAKQELESGDTQNVIADCRDKVYLNRVEKRIVEENGTSETRLVICKISGKRNFGKGQLPPCNRFCTYKGKKKSIFILPKHELRRLTRSSGLREVSGFNYNGKFNKYLWPYGISPRPTFRVCWLWKNTLPEGHYNLNLVAAQLRVIWSCIRWEDMQEKPPSGTYTETTDEEVVTRELLKRRDLAPFGLKSEYLVRKIVVPLIGEEPMDANDTLYGPSRTEEMYNRTGRRIREGLRERKKKVDEEEERRKRGPSVTESWVGEEELTLWEIKMFGERFERKQQEKENEKLRKQEEISKKLKEELKAKRYLQQFPSTPTTGKVTSLIAGSKRIFNSKNQLATPATTPAANQYAMIRTNGGQTYRVSLSALQGKTVGQQIIIKHGTNLASSTTATIISTGTPPIMASPISSNSTTVTTTTVTTPNYGSNVKLRTSPNPATTVRPLILSGSTPQVVATNNGQRIQIIKPIAGATPNVKTVNASGLTLSPKSQTTTPGSTAAAVVTTATPAATATQTIQIPLRFPDGRMQIIQIPLSMLSSSSPIQIAIPSSMGQQPTQTVTVTSTPQMASANSSSPQTPSAPQSIKIINTSNITSSPTTSSVPQPNVTRIIQVKGAQPQQTIALTPNSTVQSNFPEQIVQQIKAGNIQLRVNQGALTPPSGTTPTLTGTTVTPLGATLRIGGTTPGKTLTGLTPLAGSSIIASSISANPSTVSPSTNTRTSIVRTTFPGTPGGTRVIVQPSNTSTTIHKVTAPPLKIVSPPSQDSANAKSSPDKPFVLTQEIQDRIVRQALLNTTSTTPPEVQQKLLALQKKSQQSQLAGQVVVTPAIIDNAGVGKTITPGPGRGRGIKRGRNTSSSISPSNIANIPLTGVDGEERKRLMECQQVLRGIIDRIEKEEKNELRRKKMKEAQFQSKWKSLLSKNEAILTRETEALKREIARRRSLMEEKLRKEVQAELARETPVKRKDVTPVKKASNNSEGAAKRRKVDAKKVEAKSANNGAHTPTVAKARIKITPINPSNTNATNASSATGNKNKKLYCICKTPYDSSRFMVGCDSCHNWFHSDCLGLDEATVKKKKSWVCNDCRGVDGGNDQEDEEEGQDAEEEGSSSSDSSDEGESSSSEEEVEVKKEEPKATKKTNNVKKEEKVKEVEVEEEDEDNKLYCMCKQPYDESLFYIQCDSCQDWLHGKCVGIVSKEANLLETYNCPRCDPNSLINYCNQKRLDSRDINSLKGLMRELKAYRSAWPFLKPVDRTLVPDYYQVIKKPMDLSTMERKLELESPAYVTLAQFIGDLTLICDNCRYYNDKKSTFTSCANLLESFFLQRIKAFRQQMLQNK